MGSSRSYSPAGMAVFFYQSCGVNIAGVRVAPPKDTLVDNPFLQSIVECPHCLDAVAGGLSVTIHLDYHHIIDCLIDYLLDHLGTGTRSHSGEHHILHIILGDKLYRIIVYGCFQVVTCIFFHLVVAFIEIIF